MVNTAIGIDPYFDRLFLSAVLSCRSCLRRRGRHRPAYEDERKQCSGDEAEVSHSASHSAATTHERINVTHTFLESRVKWLLGGNQVWLLFQIGRQLHFRPGLHRDLFRPILIA